MAVLVTGGLGSLSPAPAAAGTRTPVFTFLGMWVPLGHLHMRFIGDERGGVHRRMRQLRAARKGPSRVKTGTSFILRDGLDVLRNAQGTPLRRHGDGIDPVWRRRGRRWVPPVSVRGPRRDGLRSTAGVRTKPAPMRLTAARSAPRQRRSDPAGCMHRMLSRRDRASVRIHDPHEGGSTCSRWRAAGGHEAHAMALFTNAPIVTGGVDSRHDGSADRPARRRRLVAERDRVDHGARRPDRARQDRCKRPHLPHRASDNNVTSVAGGGGALTAHFDSVGDVAMRRRVDRHRPADAARARSDQPAWCGGVASAWYAGAPIARDVARGGLLTARTMPS